MQGAGSGASTHNKFSSALPATLRRLAGPACALVALLVPLPCQLGGPGCQLGLAVALPASPTRPPTASQASCRRGGWRGARCASTGQATMRGTWAK